MSRQLLLRAAGILDPEDPPARAGALLLREGRIAARLEAGQAGPAGVERVDLPDALVAPGLVDVHYHGELVLDAPSETLAGLRRASASLAGCGVTGFLATTVAWPSAELAERVAALALALERDDWPGAVPFGLHLEGPWINPQAAGAQPTRGIRGYRPDEGLALLDRAEGRVRLVTLAPEVEGAAALQAELARRGIPMALGHSVADERVIDASIGEGVSHATHVFNAMGPIHHRGPGVAASVLADDRLSCDLIADGVHVHPDWVRITARAKQGQLVLISDRIDPAGGESERADFGSGPVQRDGAAWRLADGRLAGSCLDLASAVRNVVAWDAMTRDDALDACTRRPAQLVGAEAERGTLRPGARADLAVFGLDGSLRETWVGGRPLPAAASAAG
ncbi:MAG: N-acetylglucosamine-6-phosphate deacetylase [Myxococcota bacterium]|nr:N-acetylglucosamine-6-phosphate deacetylase [Myxococcota bacterium]